MYIAVEGCCHGCLDKIYASLNKKVQLLLICGDFESLRNKADLNCMNVPPKYRTMGDFQRYYTGDKKAPVFTIFIGGNHEASNYLEELKYGGFVAPNIYYLGRSGAVWYKGLRIVGWSGIYGGRDFMKLRKDLPLPYDRSTLRSVYHYRKDDYMKLRMLQPCNSSLVVSHDWPHGIWKYGSVDYLLKKKPFFKKDMESGKLGSPLNEELLQHLKPRYWLAAHLHVGYKVTVDWKKRGSTGASSSSKMAKLETNKDEIELDLDDEEDEEGEEIEELQSTCFVALDKCLPRRQFMEYIEVPLTDPEHPSTKKSPLYLDSEYIAVMKAVEKHKEELDSLDFRDILIPEEGVIREDSDRILKEFQGLSAEEYDRLFSVNTEQFAPTASPDAKQLQVYTNPQTTQFEEKFITSF